jgi:hypothetical protein
MTTPSSKILTLIIGVSLGVHSGRTCIPRCFTNVGCIVVWQNGGKLVKCSLECYRFGRDLNF